MKIKLGDLRSLLLEYEVTDRLTLYHRSHKDFNVGDVLMAQTDPKTGHHWLASKNSEQQLEHYRQKNHPELPSRFNCVFATFNPRSNFLGKGKLYAVRPMGRAFVADSTLIDHINENDEVGRSSFSEIEEYWAGVEPDRGNINYVEILMDSAKVVEVVEESLRMVIGTKIMFGPDAPKVHGHVSVSGSNHENPMVYASDGNTVISLQDALKILEVEGVFVSRSMLNGEHGDKCTVIIGPGFEGFVTNWRSADPGRGKSYTPGLALASGDRRGKDGVWIDVDDVRIFINAFRSGAIERR